jgi:hypothetical protein
MSIIYTIAPILAFFCVLAIAGHCLIQRERVRL